MPPSDHRADDCVIVTTVAPSHAMFLNTTFPGQNKYLVKIKNFRFFFFIFNSFFYVHLLLNVKINLDIIYYTK